MWVDCWADNRGVQKSAKHVGLQDTLNTRSRNLVEDVDSLDARWEDRPEFCLIPRLQYADDHDAKARSTACNRLGSQSKRTIEDDKNRLRMLVEWLLAPGALDLVWLRAAEIRAFVVEMSTGAAVQRSRSHQS